MLLTRAGIDSSFWLSKQHVLESRRLPPLGLLRVSGPQILSLLSMATRWDTHQKSCKMMPHAIVCLFARRMPGLTYICKLVEAVISHRASSGTRACRSAESGPEREGTDLTGHDPEGRCTQSQAGMHQPRTRRCIRSYIIAHVGGASPDQQGGLGSHRGPGEEQRPSCCYCCRVVDKSLCRMKSEAASERRGRPEAKGRVHFRGLGCMPSTILQSDLCNLTHSKRYGHVAIHSVGI